MAFAQYITLTNVAEIANWRNLPKGHILLLDTAEAEHPLRLGQIEPYAEPAVKIAESPPYSDAITGAEAKEATPSKQYGKRHK
jgi:hypothetical protein